MKKSFINTLIIGMMVIFSAHAQKTMDSFNVQVDGLGCPFCAYGLEKKFKEFKGIRDVRIDIETGDFSFTYPAEKALTLKAVEEQVVKAGYTPMSTRIKRADGSVESSDSAGETAVADASETISKQVRVGGNCGMCEARIEKAAKSIPGVVSAAWNKDTKDLKVEFDPTRADLMTIEKAVAAAGHDTENAKADTETYNNLPACCHYERLK